MTEKSPELKQKHIKFIDEQEMYFVATAGREGFVNLSPKGMDSLKVINEQKLIWLNLTGSGNESASHVLENKRMTIMFCSFTKQPLILRVYGDAIAIHPHDERWSSEIQHFPEHAGARQIFEMTIALVQTSCGYGVPYFEHKGQRPALINWADKLGQEAIEAYWAKANSLSLNGKETGILREK